MSNQVLTRVTIQSVLNGNFTRQWLHMKASAELAMSMKSVTAFYQNAMNAAVTIDNMIEWAWHQEIKKLPVWEKSNQKAFTESVRANSWQQQAMADLANNFKHAYRENKLNLVAQHLLLTRLEGPDEIGTPQDMILESVGDQVWRFIPMLVVNEPPHMLPYRDVVSQALSWWAEFKPETFAPTEKS